MTYKTLTTLVSRILFVLGGGGIVVFAYTLLQTMLAPVPVPPAPFAPASVSFDPTLDVTKNEIFDRLRPIGPSSIEIGAMGRSNPFLPPPTTTQEIPLVTSTATHEIVVTTTTTSTR